MKFLVDRCAGATLAQWLRDKGHDVREARRIAGSFDCRTCPPRSASRCSSRLLAAHEKELLEGAVVTVRGDRIRVSR
jgi:hypothetical protein